MDKRLRRTLSWCVTFFRLVISFPLSPKCTFQRTTSPFVGAVAICSLIATIGCHLTSTELEPEGKQAGREPVDQGAAFFPPEIGHVGPSPLRRAPFAAKVSS